MALQSQKINRSADIKKKKLMYLMYPRKDLPEVKFAQVTAG